MVKKNVGRGKGNVTPLRRGQAIMSLADGSKLFPITKLKEYNDAVKAFKAAITADPANAQAHAWLAYTYVTGVIDDWVASKYRGARMLDAHTEIDKAMAVAPNDYHVLWAKAFVTLHSGDAVGAVTWFDKARQSNTTSRSLMAEAADALVYAGRHQKALELINTAIADGKGVPPWYFWIKAWALYFVARTDPDAGGRYRDAFDALYLGDNASGKHPSEMLLMEAAVLTRKSKRPDDTDHRNSRNKRKAYDTIRGGASQGRGVFTLQRARDVNPFKYNVDLRHLLDGLRNAGVPEN